MENITLSEKITTIGSDAFAYCNFTNFVIPDTITTIGNSAFYNCTNLQSVTIGSNVTSIGNSAFSNCTNLTEINFNATNLKDLSSSSGVFDYAGQNGEGITVNFGDGVTRVPNYLFYSFSSSYSPNIKQINWNNVSEIGNYAFRYCDFTSLTIPSNVTSIGNGAFYYCTNLTEINYNTKNIDKLSSDNYVFAYAGQNGKGITVNFGDGVTKVPDYLFNPYDYTSYSPNIKQINWNDVTEIGSYAFDCCVSLENITLTDKITTIGSSAFRICTNLQNIYIPSIESWCNIDFGNGYSNPLYYAQNLYVGGELTTNLVIPETVTAIKNYAFYGFNGLSVTIPSNVIGIGDYAFYYCTNLQSVTIGNNVQTIGNSAFYYCTNLQSVTIGSNVQTIGNSAFYNCTNLTEINFDAIGCNNLSSSNRVFAYAGRDGKGITVNFGDGVTRVPSYLFNPYSDISYSPNIKEINWNNVTEIGSYAFAYCNFTSLTIGSGVQTIGERAFYDCRNLQSVTIGSGVNTIGDDAFYNTRALTEINFNATNLKDLSSSNGVFCDAGQNGEGITVNFGDNVEKVPDYLFCPYYSSWYPASNSPNIKQINWNDITTIGSYAFRYCVSLENITLSEKITTIGSNAFYYCTQLNRVTIESVSLANNITSSSSLGYLLNYLISEWGTVRVKCDDLTQITSSYLKGSTFIQPTEIVNGYAIFEKK